MNPTRKNKKTKLPANVKASLYLGLAAIGFCAANIVSRYPGIGNPDSKHQYQQAVSGHYYDWHPPVMAWLWSLLRVFGDGSGSIYAFHIILYWLGFGLIAITLNRIGRPRAAWVALAVGLFPPFMMMNVELLKDVGLAVAFLTAFGILFWFRAQDKKLNPLSEVAGKAGAADSRVLADYCRDDSALQSGK
jgi:hypothetical protein